MVSCRAALVLALLFGFRLVAVGGALMCTSPGNHEPAADAGHHHDGSGSGQDGKQTPFDTSDAGACCATMASCSTALASTTVISTSIPPDHAGAIRRFDSVLHFRPHSPDPPPPRS